MDNVGSVDILCTTKNRSTEVALMMQSLRTQTHKNWNLFLLDNASGTPLNSFYFINYIVNRLRLEGHFVKLLRNNNDFGVCYARNLLAKEQIRHGLGKYSMRLDDDVIVEPDYIEKLMKVINEGYDIASGVIQPIAMPEVERDVKFLNGEINKVRLDNEGNLIEFGDDCGFAYLEDAIIPAGHFRACMLYKSELNKIKYEDNLSRYGFREESFWSLRARELGYKIGVHTGAKVYHLQTPSGGGREGLNFQEVVASDDKIFNDWVKVRFRKANGI